ncbi:uncharacterized protein Z519_08820 [Cladophialophora bantiana CBS 173.52]|uniref:Xylanolytic transcriptional activator regulatory domain-containing protein n=1 Tax=Cladophialophora bantiana (strain ATCC 10958 / CBS 173.52 / CDC B-1940 / NIH 8579) TaxID=1442370 RepID=A0A0D2FUF1_CLAB1|nr:uncharacterized protein Z519_08820 [Cladophialophora bantiana CBS 173.52]KIW90177.1 hypothetical protein Z519_08820 [Cladophialophora bantiana CBS 173.52]
MERVATESQRESKKRAPKAYISDLEKRVASFERQSRRAPEALSISDEQATPDGTLELDKGSRSSMSTHLTIARRRRSRQNRQQSGWTQSKPPPTSINLVFSISAEAARGTPFSSYFPRSINHMNPLALGFPCYFPDKSGRPVSPTLNRTSSNWSFGRRVLAMAHERVMRTPLPPDNLLFEGKPYELGWDGKRHNSPESVSDAPALPSADFAMYFINAVKFRCGHESPTHTQQSPSLWYIHYLLILAFGKAFVVQRSKGPKPPGANLFVLGIKVMPDLAFSCADPIEAIQVLCCASLYLQCLDFRGAAYRIIGQALRMALENGMHTEMRSQQVDSDLAQRCRKVWWAGIADESISAELPTFPGQPQRSTAMNIQINLSKVLAQILNTVYGAEGRPDKRFLAITKEALESVANVTDQLNSSFEVL